MKTFKEQIAADNAAIFINELEFADMHTIMGVQCKAILQDISVADDLSVGGGANQNYPGIYGSRLQVNVLKADLPETPVYDQYIDVDGNNYFVESCADDMGILTIQLVANER